jgi:hypothetical protein
MTVIDQEERWLKIKEGSTGLSRKKLKIYEDYALNGNIQDESAFGIAGLFFIQPDQTIEKWQYILGHEFDQKKHIGDGSKRYYHMDDFFNRLQETFLKRVKDYHFPAKQQAEIFKMAFGELYHPDNEFPLILQGENSARKLSLNSDALIGHLFWWVKQDLKGKKVGGCWLYLIDYMESCLPYLSKKGIHRGEPDDHDAWSIHDGFRSIINASEKIRTSSSEPNVKEQSILKLRDAFETEFGDYLPYRELADEIAKYGVLIEANAYIEVKAENENKTETVKWSKFMALLRKTIDSNCPMVEQAEPFTHMAESFNRHFSPFAVRSKDIHCMGACGDQKSFEFEIRLVMRMAKVDYDTEPNEKFLVSEDKEFLDGYLSALNSWLDDCPITNLKIKTDIGF